MRAGRLRHRVEIRTPTITRGGPGGAAYTYPKSAVFRKVSITPLTATEVFAAQQTEAKVTHRIRLRYMDGLKPYTRFIHRDRVFEVVSPARDNDEKKAEMELLCIEVVGRDG